MYTRVVSDPAVLGGKPVVKGTRISVEFLLELFASGAPPRRRLEELPASHGRGCRGGPTVRGRRTEA
jgi:uncharacterized protein (DUF433 family)